MEYPDDFPPESRAAVAAEKLRAARDFDEARENPQQTDCGFDLAVELRRYILRQFGVFAREACKLGHKGVWRVDYIEEAALEFLRLCAIKAVSSKGHDKYGRAFGRNWVSNDGYIQPEVQRQFEKSGEWRQFQDALRQVAEGQEARGSLVGENQAGSGKLSREESERIKGTSSQAENATQPPPVATTDQGADLVKMDHKDQTDKARFPDRAAWVRERLRERGWNKHDVSRHGGPNHKTVQKIFDGEPVREDVLEKLAKALSNTPPSKKLPSINLLDIPQR